MNSAQRKAVIYCRVTAAGPAHEGDTLDLQEARCRDYAYRENLDVIEVFRDVASGADAERPGVQAMLGFLTAQPAEGCVVVIDDIARLARSMKTYLELRPAIERAGATLRAPSVAFGEDPESRLQEPMLAAAVEYQRGQNDDQTGNRKPDARKRL